MSSIWRSWSLPSALKVTILSKRLMNSGENFRRAASSALRPILLSNWLAVTDEWQLAANPSLGLSKALISAAPRLLVMKIIAWEKSTVRLSPSVSVPLSKMPSRRFHSASLAFSISSKSTKLSLMLSV